MPDLSINLSRGKIGLVREGREILSFMNLDASLAFVSDGREGPAAGTTDADYRITGTTRATLSGAAALPAPLKVSIERFDAAPGRIAVKTSRVRSQDLDASVSGIFQGYLTGSPRSDLQARGTIGPDALAWLQTFADLPKGVSLRAPLTVTEARLRSTGTGSAVSRTLTVNAGRKDATTISLALRQEPGLFSIDSLHVKDSDSDAVVKFSSRPEGHAFSFAGNLTGATIDRIFERGRVSSAWLKGDLRAEIPRGTWNGTTVHGTLDGGQFSIPLSPEIPVTVERFTLLAGGNTIDLGPVVLSLGQDVLQVNGAVSLSGDGVELDLDASTDRINLSTLRGLMERKTPEEHAGQRREKEAGSVSNPGASGIVRLRAAAFVLDRYQAEAVDLQLAFGTGRTTAVLNHASVCGISVTGSLRTAGSEVEVSLAPQAQGKKLAESLPCIFHKDMGISGSYDLSAQLHGRGSWDTLLRSLEGSFAFSASQGRIQSDRVVKGVIAYLNSTSLFKGSHSELMKEGVPYEAITIRGTLRDGVFSLSEGAIRSSEIHITAEGDLNLRGGTLALNVLAAPYTSLDRLLGKIPIVKYIAGKALVVVPARVEGTFDKPEVKPLPLTAVGTNITNLMKNIVQMPVKIIDPVIPKELERKDALPQE